MKVSIIIPTYNEKGNIPKLFERIFKVFKNYKADWEIIVVDDDSQDGTIDVVNKYCKTHPVRLIVRKNERGLASACTEGFNKANGDILLVMDADLQHPPEKIPELIGAIKKGSDIAIGSRYVEGGSVSDWNAVRRFVSKGAAFLVDLSFPEIKYVKDKESGFFAFRKKVIQNIKLKPKGYKILLEILIIGNYKKISEVGFSFGLRSAGFSKLGAGIIFSYIGHLVNLLWRSGKLQKFIKFCIVGLIGVVVNLGSLELLVKNGVDLRASGLISIVLSILSNFFLNRAFTFKEESEAVKIQKALTLDISVRVIGMIIQYATYLFFMDILHFYYIISMLIGIILSTAWNFIGNVKLVWKN